MSSWRPLVLAGALLSFVGGTGCSDAGAIRRAALINPELSQWSSGDSAAPDGWTLAGPGTASIHRGVASSPKSKNGLTLSNIQGPIVLYQDLPDARSLPWRAYRFSCWVKTATPDAVHLAISGGRLSRGADEVRLRLAGALSISLATAVLYAIERFYRT